MYGFVSRILTFHLPVRLSSTSSISELWSLIVVNCRIVFPNLATWIMIVSLKASLFCHKVPVNFHLLLFLRIKIRLRLLKA